MFHLAIDTSTSIPVVALLEGAACLHAWQGSLEEQHSATILRGVETCLKTTGKELADLQWISVGIGPGMFTGLRVGVATAKFLADSLEIPVVPVNSLEALVHGAMAKGAVWAISDARSKRVYALRADAAAGDAGVAYFPEELLKQFQPGDVLVGEGAEIYKEVWPESVQLWSGVGARIMGAAVGAVGFRNWQAGVKQDPVDVLPIYLKTGQAHLP